MDITVLPEAFAKTLKEVIDSVIYSDSATIKDYVDKLREQNPGITSDELAEKIVKRKSVKTGLIGAVAGLGGFIEIPVAVPVDFVCSWKIQASMAFAVAYTYGHTKSTTDLKGDLYIIIAGNTAKEAAKPFFVETSKSITKKAIDKHITRDTMVKIWKVIPRKVLTKAGEKSMTSFMKLVPLVGAPVGFVVDLAATRIVGQAAIHYYRG